MTSTPIPADCVVFDTESTGLNADKDDRLVEIGAYRMKNGMPTEESFHTYINPRRTVPQEAVNVHGLTAAFLQDKPFFEEIVDDFLAFVGDAPLVAHNAIFDSGFINAELARTQMPPIPETRFVDTLPIARKMFPGQRVTLDSLCRKYKISLSDRSLHGALVDSRLLAEVCVELNGGRQRDFLLPTHADENIQDRTAAQDGPGTFVLRATPQERARHDDLLSRIPDALWKKLDKPVENEDVAA